MASRDPARFSTYSAGAPSLQPSLALTLDTQASSARSSRQPASVRNSQAPSYTTMNEKLSLQTPYQHSSDPTMAASTSTLSSSSDPKTQDLKSWSGTLERMQDERLDKQRYVMSGNKSEEVSKIALGAKVERALARRMTGQDATFTVRKKMGESEKRSLEVEAN
ncbi:hypothetical protein LTR62_005300 [Meristemomyces frigidus]|uniref:Uncharacterized protein n=1 Tax=Meristemomyces frigidus TaxID=1508187 RepID=A0AAN7TPV1_9PEZI|nr:hypothetical protein LTR62_005300 [Meristemomyces frigidus]